MSDNNEKELKYIEPFKYQLLQSFPFIAEDFDQYTAYGLFCKLSEKMNEVVENNNNLNDDMLLYIQKFNNLKTYVDNYFANLDVQDEINTKLDEMATSGVLQSLINHRFDDLEGMINSVASGSPAGVYNTVSDLTTANPNHSHIYLVTAENKWYYYDTSTNSWTAGGEYIADSVGNELKSYQNLIVPAVDYRITFVKNQDNSITVNTPATLFGFFEPPTVSNDAFRTIQLSVREYNVPHNNLLVYDKNNNNLTVITQSSFRTNMDNYIILLWNHYGNVKGQWYLYYIANFTSLTNELASYGSISIVPAVDEKISFTIEDYTIKIKTPSTLFGFLVTGTNNTFKTIQLSNTNYLLNNNELLVYNKVNNNLEVITQSAFNSNIGNYVILVWNHYGNVKGQWYIYYIEEKVNSNQTSVITSTVDISSRQGNNGGYPENTLVGLSHSKNLGYNHVRVSFGWTSDDIPICCHNEYLYQSTLRNNDGTQITDESLKLSDMTYNTIITNYDAGIYCGSNFAGIRVPTVEDVIKQCKLLGQKLDIEYKFGYTATRLENLLKLVYKYGMEKNTLFSVVSQEIISNIQNSDYKLPIGLIAHLTQQDVTTAINSNVDRFDMFDTDTYDDDLVIELHKNNISVKIGSVFTKENALIAINRYDTIECGNIANPLL